MGGVGEPVTYAEMLPLDDDGDESRVVVHVASVEGGPGGLGMKTRQALEAALPKETFRKYSRWWDEAAVWCARQERTLVPMSTDAFTEWVRALTQTVSERTGQVLGMSSITQAIAAVQSLHEWTGHADDRPAVQDVQRLLKAHRRRLAAEGRRVKRAAITDLDGLSEMVRHCDVSTLRGLRDRVVLTWSTWAFARRAELASRRFPEDVQESEHGVSVCFAGEWVDMPRREDDLCPLVAWQEYRHALAQRGIVSGAVLRSLSTRKYLQPMRDAAEVNRVVQMYAALAGVDFDERGNKLTSRSLRVTGAVLAHDAGASVEAIREHGRWAPGTPVPVGPEHRGPRWESNAVARVGQVRASSRGLLAYEVRQVLRVPGEAFRDDVAVVFLHAVQTEAERVWRVEAVVSADAADVLGVVEVLEPERGRRSGVERVVASAVGWVRAYCAGRDLEVLKADVLRAEGEASAVGRVIVAR